MPIAYCLVLGRNADPTGMALWRPQLDSGALSRKALLRQLFDAWEFQVVHGRHSRVDEADFVTLLYNLLLGRMPDNGGFNARVVALRSSTGRGAMFDAIAGSAEFGGRHPPLR